MTKIEFDQLHVGGEVWFFSSTEERIAGKKVSANQIQFDDGTTSFIPTDIRAATAELDRLYGWIVSN